MGIPLFPSKPALVQISSHIHFDDISGAAAFLTLFALWSICHPAFARTLVLGTSCLSLGIAMHIAAALAAAFAGVEQLQLYGIAQKHNSSGTLDGSGGTRG